MDIVTPLEFTELETVWCEPTGRGGYAFFECFADGRCERVRLFTVEPCSEPQMRATMRRLALSFRF